MTDNEGPFGVVSELSDEDLVRSAAIGLGVLTAMVPSGQTTSVACVAGLVAEISTRLLVRKVKHG